MADRHSELHWLDVPERISYKLGVMTYGCQGGDTEIAGKGKVWKAKDLKQCF